MSNTTTAVRERGRAIEDVGAQGAAVPLPTFLAGAGTLTLDQRKLLVDQAIVLLEQNYVHLPLKVAMHAVESAAAAAGAAGPAWSARRDETMEPEWIFHRQMSGIFHSVRDLHTNYLLPAPFAGKIAYLPFLIEKCSRRRRRPLPRHPDRGRLRRPAVRRGRRGDALERHADRPRRGAQRRPVRRQQRGRRTWPAGSSR